jgi:transcriptional regulator with XRE-family HTH domain/tetratricopeptide (TPR) repeat protein
VSNPGPGRGNLADLVRFERERRGLSRREFALLVRRAGRGDGLTTSLQAVKTWEHGVTPMGASLRALAAVLERPVEELVAVARGNAGLPLLHASGLEGLAGADDHEYAGSVRETIRTLVGLEVRHGGNEAGPLAGRCLEAARRRLGQGGSGAEVVAAVAELAEVTGWMLHDADRQDAARRTLHEALHLSRLAGDRGMELFTLAMLAFVEIWAGRPGAALMISRTVLTDATLSSRVVAMFGIREGRALAMLGDRAGAFRVLDRSRSAMLDGVAGDEPDWAWWLDEAELLHHVGRAHASLGDHADALEILQRANALCPPARVSGRWNYLAHTLESAVAADSWSEAETMLAELLPGAGVIGSGRTESVLRTATAALERAAAGPSLRDAAQQLRHALDVA